MEITLKDGFKAPIGVVDWVALVVELQRKSNGGHIKGAYKHLGVSYAKPLDKGDGGAASKFVVRLQHPSSYAPIECLLSDLDEKYGLAAAPTLRALEVSIDFFHKTADSLALQAMTERLMVSATPSTILNPRIIGENYDFSGGVMPRRSAISATKTLYIGNKHDDEMWRVYWKRTDETFIGEDGIRVPKPLPQSEYRSRVEVRLKGKVLEKLNLISATDLRGFSYERLHSAGFFKFARRDHRSGLIFTNPYSIAAAKSLGVDDDSPACVLNGFGRKDNRGRVRQLSRHLVTDTELTEASRHALRRLTQRFS
ncbi:MAG: Uncharacterized protein AWT59_2378 [Candidatus Gallionella acididurans]|uniref:Uncharacterized protein n=1 Tax=Candidatus Gallionella acididurans TaxID=1796491 RepID=A0A139BRC3_9PROT|nr:MAG: Uncharacterized protein AWT59_2378 [Candidatus Gallionella acididurans]